MPTEVTVDARSMPPNAIDPNVHIPDNIKAMGAAADALHALAYKPVAQPQAQEMLQVTPAPIQQQAQPPVQQPVQQAERANWTVEQWQQHARSMEGRYRSQQFVITGMQEQMATLGDELVRSQAILRTAPPAPPAPVKPLLTSEDETAYGPEMIDFAKRAALEAVMPTINDLRKQNETLQRRLQTTSAVGIESTLDSQVPQWREINFDPAFKNWLRLRDIYSGRVRSDLLKEAHTAADAARVANFFKGYLAEAPASGSLDTLPPDQQPAYTPAPRQAAVPLETLTAPGHAKPPSGLLPGADASAKPTITHAQIKRFYENKRLYVQGQGPYLGRDADMNNDETFIFECQREGRVR